MNGRWLVVLVTAAVLVAAPLANRARPASAVDLPVTELAAAVQASGRVPWSGLVESSGSLQLPESESFANLAQLLGERNRLRVWWRSPDEWRIDRIRSTGETDLFRSGGTSIRWVFESATATITPVSRFRLPDASDLLPATLGRALFAGARAEELSGLPDRRIAGVAGAGLRLVPAEPAASVAHVDLWADPVSGLPLRVEVFGAGEARPTLTTTLVTVQQDAPDPGATVFRPGADTTINVENSVDVAAAAHAFAAVNLPETLAGLPTRDGADAGAVGTYGRGATTMIAFPLRDQVARPLRDRLTASATARQTGVGTVAAIGPVGVLLTDGPGRGSFLLAGTVTADTLERAATELVGGR